jgi:undecaprenyl-diphosphatase
MLEIIKAVVFGAIQGFFAWLPVSSVAHVKVIPVLLGWEDPGAAYSAVLQMGTMIAVLIYFYRDLRKMGAAVIQAVKDKDFKNNHEARLFFYILIGTIPIIVFGVLFQKQIKVEFRGMYIIAAGLIVFGILLYISEKVSKMNRSVEDITFKNSLFIGFMQVLALIPGCSRSGSTITAGFFCNLNRDSAARFSFLLGIPAFLLSGLFELFKEKDTLIGAHSQILSLIIGTLVSGVVGYLSIWFLLSYIRKHSLLIFVIYRILFGVLIIVLLSMHVISN